MRFTLKVNTAINGEPVVFVDECTQSRRQIVAKGRVEKNDIKGFTTGRQVALRVRHQRLTFFRSERL